MSEKNLRTLGNSDLQLTPIGFGAWAIGGGNWEFAWGPQDDNESIAAIHRALDLGINWIDTAAIYGLGHSEEVVARALKSWSGPRPLVFTKCSMRWNANRSIYRSLKAKSLAARNSKLAPASGRRGHRSLPDPLAQSRRRDRRRLGDSGSLQGAGQGPLDRRLQLFCGQMKRAQTIAPITSLQPPYSMLRRAIEAGVLPFCQANDIGVINYSPMVSGLLTGAMTAERVAAFPADDWRRERLSSMSRG